MKLHLATTASRNIFTAHGPGHVVVGGQRFERPVVVTPEELRADWPVQDFDTLDEGHFAWFLPLRPEVLLLGTGSRLRFPHPRLYRQLTEARIPVECMDTPAACRTYNILLGEGRKVVAAILV